MKYSLTNQQQMYSKTIFCISVLYMCPSRGTLALFHSIMQQSGEPEVINNGILKTVTEWFTGTKYGQIGV